MKKKHILILTASLVLASGILMAFSTTNPKSSSSCTESNDKCCEKKNEKAPGGVLWESLSRQFFTLSGF